jgi:hypothetical protein
MAAVEVTIESRGARLLRDLERVFRSLSRDQQRSMIHLLRESLGMPPSDDDGPTLIVPAPWAC